MIKKLAALLIMLSLCHGIDAMTPELSKNYVSMKLFHEFYTMCCSRMLGGDSFFAEYDEYDPPSLENGNRTLKERYAEWARENGVEIPTNGGKF